MMEAKNRLKGALPEMEFEGPLGFFWDIREVPLESLIKATAEIILELRRRGYPEPLILEMVKKEIEKKEAEEE